MRTPLRLVAGAFALCLGLASGAGAETAKLKLNDKGYFETRGLNVLAFSNWYDGNFSDSKISGVELIHHGVRTVTNGDVRLMATPGQWDEIGKLVSRKADPATGEIVVQLRYPAYDFDYRIRVAAKGEGATIAVELDKPLPQALVGRAGFNLEFVPSAYFHRAYYADGKAGQFPLYPSETMTRVAPPGPPVRIGAGADDPAQPLPLATGRSFTLAPGDAERQVSVTSSDGDIALYDGRNQAQNGWFVLRSLLPAARTGTVMTWTLTAATIPNWVRAPVIAHSQLGYAPTQEKVAVIELDPNDRGAPGGARLVRFDADGRARTALSAPAKLWPGDYLRYKYRTFDFSAETEPGLYAIEYEGKRTAPFKIGSDVFSGAWANTNDIYVPVAMDHMFVGEAYRVWHGDSHRDDARQAPINHEHIDLWAQGPTTDTKYKPGEHIPGLNVGGWYDAGDFDLPTETQYRVILSFVKAREEFGLDRDQTAIDHTIRRVEMHQPDGVPDALQQVEHGVLWLLAVQKNVGFAINGVTEPYLWQYHHLGDAVTKTDGLVFDPTLKPYEVKDGRSGTDDDRWAFTGRATPLNYGTAAALAAASRVLRGYKDALADDCLQTALKIWADEHSHAPYLYHHANTTGEDLEGSELLAAVELLKTTKDPKFAARIEALWPAIEPRFAVNAETVAEALPFMPPTFKAKVEPAARGFAALLDKAKTANPFGVPITEGGWAGNALVVGSALAAYELHKQFPDIVGSETTLRHVSYVLGTHPGSDISFVSGVGAISKEVAYGNNRADFSFIAGGVVPGALILKPDYPENREDWPFFWGQNEYVVALAASWINLSMAADKLAQGR